MSDAAPAYEDGQTYHVKLTRPVEIRRSKLLPREVHEMTGAFLKSVIEKEGADAIDYALAR